MDRATILVVDDENDLRASIADVLECQMDDVTILQAASGEEACSIAADRQIDAVVMDYRMPGIDGIETMRILRQQWPHIAAVMFTAYPCLQLAQQGLNEGLLDRLLIKPVDADELVDAVQRTLDIKDEAIVKDQLFVDVARMVEDAVR